MARSPDIDVSSALHRAAQLAARGQFKSAFQMADTLITEYRGDARVWHLKSEIHFRAGQHLQAVECAGEALRLDDGNLTYRVQHGRCLVMAGRRREAMTTMRLLTGMDISSAALNDAIGTVFCYCDEQALALPYLEKAVLTDSDNPLYRCNLAMVQRMLGDLDGAEKNLDRAIQINPSDAQACYVRSDLRQWSAEDNHVAQMEALLLSGIKNWRDEVKLRFALGKECEDIAAYDKSFRYVKSACDLQRRHMRYDVLEDTRVIEQIIATHTRVALKRAGGGCQNDEPVFVMGLPRSGTTLVDRILSSHSQVCSAGELSNFGAQLAAAIQNNSSNRKMSKLDMVEAALALDMDALGTAYIESTQPVTGSRRHFVDKLPFNYLYCGLIHTALPKARMILLERQSMDVCYAMYKALFVGAYPFSYSLDDIGRYYLAFRNLADHWRKVLGPALLVVRYEDLVADQEAQTRRLLEFCALEWEDACLDFHNNQASASTASAVQVRQPIYASSVGRWRCYAEQLRPLRKILEAGGIVVGCQD